MVDLQRHEKFYELFKQNGWNGLLNVHGTPVNLPDFVKQCPNWNTDVDAAVLDTMGFKWDDNKEFIIDR